jgi:hypothetical protein
MGEKTMGEVGECPVKSDNVVQHDAILLVDEVQADGDQDIYDIVLQNKSSRASKGY